MSHTVHGPKPLRHTPNEPLGKQIYNELREHQHIPEALVDAATGESVSYKRLLEETYELAISLQRLGVVQNDVISVCSANSVYFFHPVIAAFYIGAVVAPLNHHYTTREVLHVANITKPKIIFCSKATLDKVIKLKTSVKHVQNIVVLDSSKNTKGYACLKDLIDNNTNFDKTALEPIHINTTEQLAALMCSSGTTGLPKSVMLTHRNIQTAFEQIKDGRFLIQNSPGEAVVNILPFFHAYGFNITLAALTCGRKTVFLKKFEKRLFLQTVQDHKCKNLILAPPVLIFLAKDPIVEQYDLSSLKDIFSGAAPLRKDTEEAVKKRLNIPSIRQGYGMTEITIIALSVPLRGSNKPGSCGMLMPFTTGKVRDLETHETLGPGQVGELCFKGDAIAKGYFGNEEETRNMKDNDGFLCTGDVGYYDEDHYFYIVDRIKELIKYRGFQVAPAELEALLLTHPNIQDAGIIGLPDTIAGELPLAFVVKKTNSYLTETDVKDFVAEHLSHQKQLRGGVIFVDEIPKNSTGKILRRELRELLQKQKSKL